ncbi:hypothetical protein CATMIT_01753, partial [Catenibacterium mitsuokai DSM 15897]
TELGQDRVHLRAALFEHEAHRQIAPAIDPVGAAVVIVGVNRAKRVGAARGLGDGAVVGDVAVLVGQVLGETFDPPHGLLLHRRLEVAPHVEAAVEVVHVLVGQVPDLERRTQPLGFIGDEARLVARRRRIAFQVHAAVVGVDAEDRAGVDAVIVAAVEHRHFQAGVVVAGDRHAAGGELAVEIGFLPGHGGASAGQ